MSVVYDAGMLVAADRSNREAWADHRIRLEFGLAPIVTAPVVAQTSRSGRQAQLRRLLRGCSTVPFAPDSAHEVGALLAASATSDVVDAHVAMVASAHRGVVITSDVEDFRRLAPHLAHPIGLAHV